MRKVKSFYWNKLSSKSCSFESSIYDYCVIRQKEFSRKVGMSKVESFYWNKLGSKRCSFEQFFDVFCFSCSRGLH